MVKKSNLDSRSHLFHRIASSENYSSSLQEIKHKWSLEDLIKAHHQLDIIQEQEVQAMEEAEHS